MISQREEYRRQLNLEGDLPQSYLSTDVDSYDAQLQDDFIYPEKEEPEHVASGDPLWVARPRNAFIIFRCEYARRHSRVGRRSRGTGSSTEKSLSKRAAEAWHQLSSEEKGHFKALAEEERKEHARLYPYYRFRPVKRPPSKRCLHSGAVSVTSQEHYSDQEAEIEAIPNQGGTRDNAVHGALELTSSPLRSSLSLFEFLPGVKPACTLDSVHCLRGSPEQFPPTPMTPSIPYLTHPGSVRPLSTSDFNSILGDDLACPENPLASVPQHRGYMDTSIWQPTTSASTTSSLANWDGKAAENVAPLIPAHIRPQYTCDSMIDVGLDYDALLCYAADSAGVSCPGTSADLRVTETGHAAVPEMDSPRPSFNFHEVEGSINTLLHHH